MKTTEHAAISRACIYFVKILSKQCARVPELYWMRVQVIKTSHRVIIFNKNLR